MLGRRDLALGACHQEGDRRGGEHGRGRERSPEPSRRRGLSARCAIRERLLDATPFEIEPRWYQVRLCFFHDTVEDALFDDFVVGVAPIGC